MSRKSTEYPINASRRLTSSTKASRQQESTVLNWSLSRSRWLLGLVISLTVLINLVLGLQSTPAKEVSPTRAVAAGPATGTNTSGTTSTAKSQVRVETVPALSDQPRGSWGLRRTPVVDVVRRVRDCVVNIHSERALRTAAPRPQLEDGEPTFGFTPPPLLQPLSGNRVNGMGTGIIIDGRGYIVTNQHVVDDVQVLRVRLADGTTLPARILARDAEQDLALIRIHPAQPLPVLPLGTARDLMVGETVVAIGNAFGYDHSVTAGVVSAVGRDVNLNKSVRYRDLIQTDASINPGNSGGPLLNLNGELVGVNVAIRAGAQGIGFAIPVDTMVRVVGNLLTRVHPNVSPNYLGWTLTDDVSAPTRELPSQRRVVVEKVEPGSIAERGGLRKGDVLLRVGNDPGKPIHSSLDPLCALMDAPERLKLVVRRGTNIQVVTLEPRATEAPLGDDRRARAKDIRVAEASLSAGAARVWKHFGIRVQPVNAAGLGLARGTSQLRGGLIIEDIRAESPAYRAGLRSGDVLVGVHQWEMLEVDNLLYILDHPDRANFSPLRFFITRAGQVHRGIFSSLD